MKRIKVSKITWLILSAGLFLVIMVSLGVTRSSQQKEQNRLEEELILSTARIEKLETAEMRPQLEDIQRRVNEAKSQCIEAAQRLDQMIESVDVTDKFFAIAAHHGIQVDTMSNSRLSSQVVNGVELITATLSASVSGETSDIIDFIISLNDGYTTGYVQSAQININCESSDHGIITTANIQMVVYSYKGN